MTRFSDCLLDTNIFPSFIVSTDLTSLINTDDVRSDFINLRNNDSGVKRTNIHGWHSKPCSYDDGQFTLGTEFQHIKKIFDLTEEFVNDFLESNHTNLFADKIFSWLLENGPGAYNVIHNHGKLDLIGVYYVEVPKKSEGLTLVRTDAFTHTALCSSNGSKEFDSEFTIDAIVGRLYIIPGNLYHYVKPFDDEGYRRSIVFNINCSQNNV